MEPVVLEDRSNQMAAGPVRVVIVEGPGAVAAWKAIADSTRLDHINPLVHASGSQEEALQEIDFFFGDSVGMYRIVL